MSQSKMQETLPISGMTCASCAQRIEAKVLDLPGVESAVVCYQRGTAKVSYDTRQVSREKIVNTIEGLGYRVSGLEATGRSSRIAGSLLILLAGYLVVRRTGLLNLFNVFPQAEAGMGYGLLFVIGLLTSVHCVAMCGGINLSQCLGTGAPSPHRGGALRPSLLYNAGRVVSYTATGAIVGALGSVIRFSGAAKGVVQLGAGIFMIIMGINMLGLFPWLRRFSPRLPGFLAKTVQGRRQGNGPLVVGLLNGLMPCGPLQAMQLYALSTGSPVKGAMSMLLFCLGTVPVMFGLGALSTILSKRFAGRMVTAGAVLVVILGASMFQNGLALSGFTSRPAGAAFAAAAVADGESNPSAEGAVQIVNTELSFRGYQPITVASGTPVRWTITAQQGTVNGCNYRLFIPEYGIEKQLEVGENVIEFTPTESGTYLYSCWMGMIRSTITVTDE